MIGHIAFLPFAELQALRPPTVTSSGLGVPELVLFALVIVVFLFLLRPSRRRHGDRQPRGDRRRGQPDKSFRHRRDRNWILVDGSNVMHWEDNTPHIEPVRRVVAVLKAQGLDPGVVFDANAGWKLMGRYLGETELGKILDLPPDQVLVVPKGSPADPWLLTTARDFGARIVTNDRFRDWAEAHPEVDRPGFLVRGSLSGSGVWLEGMQGPVDNSGA
jgi:Zc3h12a-like Ribonuclease NYN domain